MIRKEKKNLSSGEWNQIIALPADGVAYNVPGIAFRAVHYPKTKMKAERVIAETQYGTLRRFWLNDKKKWSRADHIGGRA